MSVTLTINGVSFDFPETGDEDWGSSVTNWASAVTAGMLQKAGGTFTLTADANFGSTYGLLAKYFTSVTANAASAGSVRLAKTDTIDFRDNSNSANLPLGIDGSDNLTFGGEVIPAGLITDADIDAAAAIEFSKMEALSASRAAITNGSGVMAAATTTSTEIGYVNGVTSAIQTQLTARLQLAGGTMTGSLVLAADPTTAFQAATKGYVDALAAGINAKTAVRVATTANGTLASAFENGDTVDGVVLATNDRILIKNQSAPAENGIYTVNASGAPTRATDADTWAELLSAYVFVSAGTANTATSWVCNVAAGGTINVTAITFVQFSASQAYTATNQGVLLTGSQFSLQLDSTTLSQSASGVKVATGGLTNTQVNASAAIAFTKMAALTANIVPIANGSGFLIDSVVNATVMGYISGLESDLQTQLDDKIAASTLTTNGDILYRAGGVPARLAKGTANYFLQAGGSLPAYVNFASSFTEFISSASTFTIPTSWTSFTLAAANDSFGTAVSRSTNSLTMPYSGIYEISVEISYVGGTSGRNISVRFRNTTDSITVSKAVADTIAGSGSGSTHAVSLRLYPDIASDKLSKTYEVQVCASGSGLTATQQTIASEASLLWRIAIFRLPYQAPITE